MTSIPPPAEELRLLDHELARLDARRAQLLTRRAWLVGVVQQPSAAATPPGWQGWAPRTPAPSAPARETAPSGVQNVLLTLGGILLAIGAIAFTVVSWGALGIGGRSAVLAAITLGALALPAVLLRRGLSATAEAIACVGLLLTVLDAYALHTAALPDTDPLGYAAAASAVLAALWTGYGLILPRLHVPAPAGIATAQLPLLFWWAASEGGPHLLSAAFLATSAASTSAALLITRAPARVTAAAGAAATGVCGLLTAAGLAFAASTPSEAIEAAAHLACAAALASIAAWRIRHSGLATATAAIGALAVLLATVGVLRTTLPGDWTVVAQLLCAAALLTLVRSRLPRPVRLGVAGTSAAVLALAFLWTLPALGTAVLGPVEQLAGVWAGATDRASVPGADGLAVVTALLLLAGVLAVAHRLGDGRPWRTPAGVAAAAFAWAALTVVPLALSLDHAVESAAHLALATLALATSVATARSTRPSRPLAVTTLACFFTSALTASLLALAAEPTTFLALGTLLALTIAATALHPSGARRSVLAVTAVGAAAGIAVAAPSALELPAHQTAFALLTVPAVTALLGAHLRAHTYALPVELAGAAAALVALTLAATDTPALSLALALAGAIASGTALRADRRPAAAYTAGALFLLATWVRLAASGITTPEAYTLPVTVLALAIGFLRRRRDPEASSWAAYGPGLAVTLLPSLAAAWGDPHWLRPLLLGSAALLVTLLGARHRLQAPLALGGTTLALVAVHELAPYVVQVVGALPRWLPPAAAGMLLLALGATYEQRLRNARRLRELVGRMH
ncbi:SCO7613 C-terminal domain-containing membrane protein [Streptomyces indicus]|uniref:Uncharacterized protein n=1 Tax=Streptomyces indicus TaxID=417292 RepID=A0A1G8XIW7_9ACTN|nr:hypothetical protein [Streptomyces indicus]SDJ89700.1 hypothetical protein SAMN05421806_103192 [Streptomyces indicus]